MCRLIDMNENIDQEKSEEFLEILQNEKSFNSKIEQEVIFITTDIWLAQLGLGPRKNN